MTSLIAADLRAQAEAHMDSAVRTATDQLARGYTPRDVLHGLSAVADIVADLLEQAQDARDAHDDELDRIGFGHIADATFIATWRGRRAS